ncbi:pentapeptide repeat-containing protein [Pseudanabaenaceae cyanobacterium LEGE 13415]|nr:pentapeptide repeat-containing protein [Pseudanabaenaceae cyanobacterium LEGE 13415]
MTHFINRDLRNRSFRRKNFALTNFRGADIRGCDFSGAILSGSDFANVKAGLSIRQRIYLALWVIAILLFAGDVMSRLFFNTIGQSPLDFTTPHVSLFYGIVNLAGITSAIAALTLKTKLGRILTITTGALVGSILAFGVAFFYPGLLSHLIFPPNQPIFSTQEWLHRILSFLDENNTMIAIYSAPIGVAIMLLFSKFRRRTTYKVTVSILGAIANYVAAFFWSTIANAFFINQNSTFGIASSVATIVFLAFTFLSINRIIYELQNAIGTSFRGAELTHTRFEYADLRNTDFSQAIGFSPYELK